jgi:hypothetical protein
VTTVNIALQGDLAGAAASGAAEWQHWVAAGETLGRLLARLVNERSGFGRLYDQERRQLAEGLSLRVNGRAYELIGGLTYILREGDRLSFESGR